MYLRNLCFNVHNMLDLVEVKQRGTKGSQFNLLQTTTQSRKNNQLIISQTQLIMCGQQQPKIVNNSKGAFTNCTN